MKTLDQFLNERLGGKGYKPYTSLTGKKISGDWEDSDRGAGNKAKKRAGGKVEKKSPTYRAHVLNKEEVVDESMGGGVPLTPQELEIQKKMSRLNVRLARKRSQQMQKAKVDDTETAPEQVKEASAVLDANKKLDKEKKTKKDKAELAKLTHIYKGMKKGIYNSYDPEGEELKEYSPNVTYQAKGGRKSGKLGKSSVYSLKDKGESKKEFRKSYVKDIKGGYLKTEEVVKEGDVHSGQGEKIQKRTKAWMDKKGQKGAPGLDAMRARAAEHKANRGVKEEVIDERTLSSYIPSDRQGEASAANREYVKGQLKKKEDESTKNRGNLSKRDAGKMAKEKLRTKKIMSMGEGKVDEGLGAAYAVGGVSNAIASVAKAYGASQAAKGAIIGGALSGGGAVVGGALNYAASRNKNKKSESKKKKMKEDKAFNFVVDKLRKQYGKDAVLTKGQKPKPLSAAQKKKNAAIRAKRAKEDHRDPTEKASDGRYSDRHSNRGSD